MLGLALLACGPGLPEVDAELAARLDAALDAGRLSSGAPGVAAAVLTPEGATWLGAAGLADVEQGLAVDPTHGFRIGSITKTYVSATTLALADAGTLSVDDPVAAWIDDVPFPDLTLRHLLGHTSGLVDYTETPEFLQHLADPWTLQEVVAACVDDGPLFAPGQAWSYSNTNYHALALVLEAVTGGTWAEAVGDGAFVPARLGSTWAEGWQEAATPLVRGYLGDLDVTEGIDPVWTGPAGGIVATAADVVKWLLYLFHGDVLSEEGLALMRTPVTLTDGSTADYGLGLYLVEVEGSVREGHTGSTMGFQSDAFLDDDRRIIVAVLVNDFAVESQEVSAGLWSELLEWYDPT